MTSNPEAAQEPAWAPSDVAQLDEFVARASAAQRKAAARVVVSIPVFVLALLFTIWLPRGTLLLALSLVAVMTAALAQATLGVIEWCVTWRVKRTANLFRQLGAAEAHAYLAANPINTSEGKR